MWRGPTAIKPGPIWTGVQPTIQSSSDNDTILGTGLRQVRVIYVDTAGIMLSDVALAGQTQVQMVADDVAFIQCMHSIENGTYGGVAAGNITVTSGATVLNVLPAGGNRCTSAHRLVPANKVMYLKSWHCSSASGANRRSLFRLRTTSLEDGEVFDGTFLFRSAVTCFDTAYGIEFYVPLRIPPIAEVKISAIVTGAVDITAEFNGWCEDS